MKKHLWWVTIWLLGCGQGSLEEEVNMPNVLWVSVEDITTMLGSYGDPNASTPNLDAFAENSVRFDQAFASAPVCSPSRSCIITGHFANTLGSQHLRSEVKIPNEVVPFPKYLQEAGYYVTNSYKEDYNFTDSTIWNESSHQAHWKNRPADQPFFSVFNLTLTHQSSIFGNDSVYLTRIADFLPHIQQTSPENLVLPPYYPDTPGVRKLWARYYTNVSVIDYQFGQILQELKAKGLDQNTIIFFFSDHGTGMPRSKRAAYDSGLKIPLLVYFPPRYARAFGYEPGTSTNRLVSFEDFAPTMLELAGLKKPENWPGRSFISKDTIEEKEYVFGAADRVDEGYELARTLRNQQYRYIRNFLPGLPLLQPNFYTDQSEIMQELEKVRYSDNLNEAQRILFASERPVEELYDVVNDPHQLHNLAEDPAHQETLLKMRQALREKMIAIHDTGLIPEPVLIDRSRKLTPFELARDPNQLPVVEIMNTCDLMLEKEPDQAKLLKAMNHPDGLVRYWALMTVQAKELQTSDVLKEVSALLKDELPVVQIEAAKILIEAGHSMPVETITRHLNIDKDYLALYAARTYQLIASRITNKPEQVDRFYQELVQATKEGTYWDEYYKIYAYWALTGIMNRSQSKI